MITEKLYYADSYINEFTAQVLQCEACANGFYAILSQTAFFPEGGGQKADTGCISNVKVFDVQEENGVIKHYVKTQLNVGDTVTCKIDWEQRFNRMQNHSGEHIVSGVVHGLYGYDNVGFHMEEDYVTVDFNGELTLDQVLDIEDRANKVIYEDITVECYFPEKEDLPELDYRSKLDLTENVRLVEIQGVDLCACCAPHVKRTGEIGLIKILDVMRHRNGVRITMKSGYKALRDYREKQKSVVDVSNLLSAKQLEIAEAVDRLKAENDNLKSQFYNFKMKIAEFDRERLEKTGEISYYISCFYDADMMRELVNYGMSVSKLSVVFSGNDSDGYSYIAGSDFLDMISVARNINSCLNGKGGGRGTMVQGKVSVSKKDIMNYISNLDLGEI
ncbi:MAG: alanine--tRNA ligase-related protein [Acutalibacteraceae bacterium]